MPCVDSRGGARSAHRGKLCAAWIPSIGRKKAITARMHVNYSRRQLLQGALASAVPLTLFGCSGGAENAGREPLVVGGLPVTCNLTLPVACVAKDMAIKAGTAKNDFRFEYSKYSGWPEIKESLMSNRIQAGYMLA